MSIHFVSHTDDQGNIFKDLLDNFSGNRYLIYGDRIKIKNNHGGGDRYLAKEGGKDHYDFDMNYNGATVFKIGKPRDGCRENDNADQGLC